MNVSASLLTSITSAQGVFDLSIDFKGFQKSPGLLQLENLFKMKCFLDLFIRLLTRFFAILYACQSSLHLVFTARLYKVSRCLILAIISLETQGFFY